MGPEGREAPQDPTIEEMLRKAQNLPDDTPSDPNKMVQVRWVDGKIIRVNENVTEEKPSQTNEQPQ